MQEKQEFCGRNVSNCQGQRHNKFLLNILPEWNREEKQSAQTSQLCIYHYSTSTQAFDMLFILRRRHGPHGYLLQLKCSLELGQMPDLKNINIWHQRTERYTGSYGVRVNRALWSCSLTAVYVHAALCRCRSLAFWKTVLGGKKVNSSSKRCWHPKNKVEAVHIKRNPGLTIEHNHEIICNGQSI